MDQDLLDILRCPACNSSYRYSEDKLLCHNCKATVPVVDSIPRFNNTTLETVIRLNRKNVEDHSKWTVWRRKNFTYFEEGLKGLSKESKMLDIGAGSAPFARLFGSYATYGVDFAPHEKVHVLTDLNKALPFKDGSFDVMVMSNVLEHIQEPQALLKESYRLLKDNGRLLITVPFLIKVHQAPHDYLRYTEYMLKALLGRAGFADIRVDKIGNIYDVHEVILISILKLCVEKNNNTIVQRLLYALYKLCRMLIKAMIGLSGYDIKEKADSIGCPHGYGCTAYKRLR